MVLHCTVLQVAALADDYTAEPQAADDVDLAVSAVGRGRGGGRGEGRGPGWVGGRLGPADQQHRAHTGLLKYVRGLKVMMVIRGLRWVATERTLDPDDGLVENPRP